MSEPRQIIIEISGDGKNLVLRKDETASVFERVAFLTAIIQTPDVPIVPLAGEKPMPEALRDNQNNIKKNERSTTMSNGRSKGGGNSKRPKILKGTKQ